MIFIITAVSVWLIFAFLYYRFNKTEFTFSKTLLPLLIFSIIVTFDLGINYIAGATPALNDGITVHSVIFPFKDSGWSIELFRRYYFISITISCVLLLLYMAAHFIKPSQKNNSLLGGE